MSWSWWNQQGNVSSVSMGLPWHTQASILSRAQEILMLRLSSVGAVGCRGATQSVHLQWEMTWAQILALQILRSCFSEHQSLRVQARYTYMLSLVRTREFRHTQGDTQVSICLTTHLTQTNTQKGVLLHHGCHSCCLDRNGPDAVRGPSL